MSAFDTDLDCSVNYCSQMSCRIVGDLTANLPKTPMHTREPASIRLCTNLTSN